MKTSAKNLTHSPALVFFLIMGIRSAYTLSVILPRTDFGWDTLTSVLTGILPFVIAAALFFRLPKLLYLPFAVQIAVDLCWLILEFAEIFAAGTAYSTDVLLVVLCFVKIALYGMLAWMTFRFGERKSLWFLPVLLYLVYSIGYRVYVFILAGGGAFNLSLIFDLVLTIPAYAFLGYWLAHPYKRSYLLKIQNSFEQEENTHA